MLVCLYVYLMFYLDLKGVKMNDIDLKRIRYIVNGHLMAIQKKRII